MASLNKPQNIQTSSVVAAASDGLGIGLDNVSPISTISEGLFEAAKPNATLMPFPLDVKSFSEVSRALRTIALMLSEGTPYYSYIEGSPGMSVRFSRDDHQHPIDNNIVARVAVSTATPTSVATTPVIGEAIKYSREDHVHDITLTAVTGILHDQNLDLGTGDFTAETITILAGPSGDAILTYLPNESLGVSDHWRSLAEAAGNYLIQNYSVGAWNTKLTLDTSGNLTIPGTINIATHTPSGPTDTGTTGTITWDSDYIYVCTATDTWKRAAISSGGW